MKNKIFIAQLTSLNFSVKWIQTSRSIWGEYIDRFVLFIVQFLCFLLPSPKNQGNFSLGSSLYGQLSSTTTTWVFQLEEISQLFSPADFRSPFKWLCYPPSLDKRAGGSHTQAWAMWQEVPFILRSMSVSYFEYIIPSVLKNSVKIIIKKTEALI